MQLPYFGEITILLRDGHFVSDGMGILLPPIDNDEQDVFLKIRSVCRIELATMPTQVQPTEWGINP